MKVVQKADAAISNMTRFKSYRTCIPHYVSPLQGPGDILFFPLRLSVTKSCPLYNLITITDISTKLHTFVKPIETTCHRLKLHTLVEHNETMCHAQEP